jgi:hypothetical protein
MKNIILASLFAATTASAVVDIKGTYEGTFTDGNPGAATYAQDLDLTLVGSVDDTKVTVMMENLTGDSVVKTNQVFIETKIEGLNFKGGNFDTLNGTGLLQASSAVANQMELGFDVAGNGVTLGQASGVGKVTVDASASIAGVDVNVQNASASDRFITVVANWFGFGVTAETQETAVARNNAVSASMTVGGMGVTAVMVDVNDATAVTQDDGVFGDISDTVNGESVVGGVVSVDSVVGKVTGKVWEKNSVNNYKGELDRGVMNYSYEKNEATDGIFAAKLNVTF